jgi:predicted ATPase
MLGWDTVEELHRGTRSALTRVRRPSDGTTFVFKQSLARTAEDAVQREERVLSVLLGCEGVIRSFGVASEQQKRVLVLENFEGESLQRRLLRGRFMPTNALGLALSILSALGKVHARGIVHGDLCPENVLLAVDGACRLIDFASAMPIGTELPRAAQGNVSARAMAYAAPEQMGRGPRRVDRRTDYYRFGALLYELVTGRPLFDNVDAEELAHSHAARLPRPPRELVPELSPALERVILKLLAKDPDARYQTEARLREALECCREAARRGESDFDGLSTEAEAPSFVLTTRLFGRDALLARLERAVERSFRGHRGAIALEGPEGIGKSALALELGRRVSARGGLFVRVKFDVEHAADPGLALQRALEALAEQLAVLAGTQVLSVRERLDQYFPGAASELLSLCPALAPVLPDATRVERREGAVEALPRALGTLLRVLAEQGTPGCLFIDDLQWMPISAWRALREVIAAAECGALAVVMAAQSEGADGAARSAGVLAELAAQGYAAISENLPPLNRQDVRQLLAQSLSQEGADLDALDDLLWKWSLGNPLYAHTLLEAMAQRCVAFDSRGRPYVELGRARSLLAEGNVDALLGQRFRALPADTRHALGLAACLGSNFELAVLAGATEGDVHACLAPGVAAGLLAAVDGAAANAILGAHGGGGARFAHERARMVVTDGVEDEQLAARHHALGRVFRERLTAGYDRRTLFAAVEHLERARRLLSAEELTELATLQLRATREATRAGHGDLALELARRAVAALPARAWDTGPARVRALLAAEADAALDWGDADTWTAVLETLRAHATEPLQLAEVLILEGRIHQAQFRGQKALEAYLQALSVLRAPLAEKPSEREQYVERERTAELLRPSTDESIVNLPECRDERVRREVFLLGKALLLTGASNHAALAVAACRIIRHGLRHGHAPESALGYAMYAQIYARDQSITDATRYARIALDVAERTGSAAVLAFVQFFMSAELLHLSLPFKQLAPQFQAASHNSLAAGSVAQACCAITTASLTRFWAGENLNALAEDLTEQRALHERGNHKLVLNWHDVLKQLVQNLRVPTAQPEILAGEFYDEAARVPQHRASGDSASLLHYAMAKALLAVVYRAPKAALAAMAECEQLAELYGSSMWTVPLHTLDALARLMALTMLPDVQPAREHARIHADIAEIQRLSAHNPQDCEHRLRLLSGLDAESAGQHERASLQLAEAVELAAREGSAWEAIAAESTARFWIARGEQSEARAFMQRAHRAYLAWGALGKAEALSRELPDLLAPAERTPTEQGGPELDVRTLRYVLRASLAFAGELRLDALLERIVAILLEATAAESAYVLLRRGNAWLVEAGRGRDGCALPTLSALDALALSRTSEKGLDLDLVRKAARTGEVVRVEGIDATVRASVCLPLKAEGEIEVVVYLDNLPDDSELGQTNMATIGLLSEPLQLAVRNARAAQKLAQTAAEQAVALQQKEDELAEALAKLRELQGKQTPLA